MATNPMKRRENNAFLIGLVIGLILTVVVGVVLYAQNKKVKDQLKQEQSKYVTVVVAANDIKSGVNLTASDLVVQRVVTTLANDAYVTDPSELLGAKLVDEDTTNTKNKNNNDDDDTDDTEKKKDSEEDQFENCAKFDIKAGTIITKDMLYSEEESLTDDLRIQEYASIQLPSELAENEFIDVRFTLPSGQDYVVVSHKKVEKTTDTEVWMKVNEAEILLLNSAMVEKFTIEGTRLYATKYVDPGLQDKINVTYIPSHDVQELIQKNPNIVDTARDELNAQMNKLGKSNDFSSFRDYIDEELSKNIEDRDSSVEEGFTSEATTIQSHRAEFIENLEKGAVAPAPTTTTTTTNTTTK